MRNSFMKEEIWAKTKYAHFPMGAAYLNEDFKEGYVSLNLDFKIEIRDIELINRSMVMDRRKIKDGFLLNFDKKIWIMDRNHRISSKIKYKRKR